MDGSFALRERNNSTRSPVMRPTPILTLLAVAAGFFFASGALALEQRSGMMHTGERAAYGEINLHSGEALIGTQVRGADGQELGRITDIMVNFQEGSVGYAEVTATDGQTYLVPVAAFRTTHDEQYVTLDADETRLTTAPRLQPGVAVGEFQRNLHEHYGLGYPWDDLPGEAPLRQEETPAPGLSYPGHRDVIPPGERR
jgi:sporulation protein YlmC with PRC-barrel domain